MQEAKALPKASSNVSTLLQEKATAKARSSSVCAVLTAKAKSSSTLVAAKVKAKSSSTLLMAKALAKTTSRTHLEAKATAKQDQ